MNSVLTNNKALAAGFITLVAGYPGLFFLADLFQGPHYAQAWMFRVEIACTAIAVMQIIHGRRQFAIILALCLAYFAAIMVDAPYSIFYVSPWLIPPVWFLVRLNIRDISGPMSAGIGLVCFVLAFALSVDWLAFGGMNAWIHDIYHSSLYGLATGWWFSWALSAAGAICWWPKHTRDGMVRTVVAFSALAVALLAVWWVLAAVGFFWEIDFYFLAGFLAVASMPWLGLSLLVGAPVLIGLPPGVYPYLKPFGVLLALLGKSTPVNDAGDEHHTRGTKLNW